RPDGLTRRELAEEVGWNYMTSVRALDELVAQELAQVVVVCPPRRYRLLSAASLALGVSLTAPAALTPVTAALTPSNPRPASSTARRSQGFTGGEHGAATS